ncbi:head-to-tail connecting protein [Modicisalibacter xianhensis]|uniref:Head-to-tail connecting protein n=1 Tax=Modicisalibacter xianhensis TaxID=442341 RepID=A0A4R8G3Z9_9GAMM|nr:portal protein [Halomonas xianhensis]TDX30765.1 head-to-tail connecting protein [Halomonas xianhensis]
METKRQRYQKRLAALKQERTGWESQWRDISDWIQPWRSRFTVTDTNKGDRRNKNIVNETPLLSLRTLASGMMAGVTSPARPWFKLEVPDPELMEIAEVKQWLYEVERRMRTALSQANVYNALHQLYTELGGFGTSAIIIVEDDEDIFRAVPLTVGTYYLACSHRMVVDTMYREFQMTVRQVVQQFGKDACSDSVQKLYEQGQLEAAVDVVHLIEPNDERDPGKQDNRNMPFRSVYYEAKANGDKLLSESGFEEFAVLAPRWEVLGEDTYGYGPGSIAVGSSRALQTMERKKAQAVEKMINPPMNVPSSMKNGKFSMTPGAINYIDPTGSGQNKAEPSHVVNLPIQYVMQDIVQTESRIQQTFFADLFLMLANDNRSNITAREIQERHEEKLLMLGPVLERLQTELLDPLIDRVFGIMLRNGHLPEPPDPIQGTELRVEYVSVMAQAQKLVGVGAIERLAGFVGNLAGADPEVLDKLDLEQMVDQYGQSVSAPPDIIRSDEDVQERRRQRAQQAQAQQMAQAGMQAAQGAKLLSETDTSTENGLTALMRQMGMA